MKVAAVILAAGQGSRLGGVVKAMIRIDGEPLVLRQIAALRGPILQNLVIAMNNTLYLAA